MSSRFHSAAAERGGILLIVLVVVLGVSGLLWSQYRRVHQLEELARRYTLDEKSEVARSSASLATSISDDTDCLTTIYALDTRKIGTVATVYRKISELDDKARKRRYHGAGPVLVAAAGSEIETGGSKTKARVKYLAKHNVDGVNFFDLAVETFDAASKEWRASGQFTCPKRCTASSFPFCAAP